MFWGGLFIEEVLLLINSLGLWLHVGAKTILPISQISKAIIYSAKRWDGLGEYLHETTRWKFTTIWRRIRSLRWLSGAKTIFSPDCTKSSWS